MHAYGWDNGRIIAMKDTIQMDASGRLVLPKPVRERLNLRGGSRLRAEVVAGRVELVPVASEARPALKKKSGITVLAKTGARADAAAAVAAEREEQEARGLAR